MAWCAFSEIFRFFVTPISRTAIFFMQLKIKIKEVLLVKKRNLWHKYTRRLMVMMRYFFIYFFSFFLLASFAHSESVQMVKLNSSASKKPAIASVKRFGFSDYLNTSLNYSAKWNGVKIGDAYVDIRPDKQNYYDVETKIRAVGLVKAISNFESATKSRIAIEKGAVISKGTYMHKSQLRKKKRTITVNFDANHVIAESMNPVESPGKRPQVSSLLKSDVFNPLSVFVAGWGRIIEQYQFRQNGLFEPYKFVLPVYDGRRRSDAHITFAGEKNGLLEVLVKLKPVEGYSNNELKNFKDRKYHVKGYIDSQTYLPVRIEGSSKIGDVYITLNKQCKKPIECRI